MNPKVKRALLEMEKLGLLDVVKEIAQTDRGFREALGNWAEKKADLATLFDLMDMGMPTGKKIQFLSPPQRARVREITVQMGADAAGHLVDALEQPGRVLDTPTLIQEFGLKGAEIRQLTQMAQEALLDDPILVVSPERLTERVRQRMRQIKTATVRIPTAEEIEAGELEASYFNLGDTILYGKYKNHRGIIKEFKQDERGVPTAVIQPDPQGRKKDKEIGVFKFWHADPLKRQAGVFEAPPKWKKAVAEFLKADPVVKKVAARWVVRQTVEQRGREPTRQITGGHGSLSIRLAQLAQDVPETRKHLVPLLRDAFREVKYDV